MRERHGQADRRRRPGRGIRGAGRRDGIGGRDRIRGALEAPPAAKARPGNDRRSSGDRRAQRGRGRRGKRHGSRQAVQRPRLLGRNGLQLELLRAGRLLLERLHGLLLRVHQRPHRLVAGWNVRRGVVGAVRSGRRLHRGDRHLLWQHRSLRRQGGVSRSSAAARSARRPAAEAPASPRPAPAAARGIAPPGPRRIARASPARSPPAALRPARPTPTARAATAPPP